MLVLASVLNLLGMAPSTVKVVDAGVASMSKHFPFENEDAYFLQPPHFYGVFDGVSAGKQSRAYAQTLAKVSCEMLSPEFPGTWNEHVFRALTVATLRARDLSGCSTAMLINMDLEEAQPQARVYCLGDCQALVLRQEGDSGRFAIAAKTTAKYHLDNGAPYQFGGKDFKSDKIEDGETFAFEVLAGDIVLAFTDGVANNYAPCEIEELVSRQSTSSAEQLAAVLVSGARDRRKPDDDCTALAVKLGDSSLRRGEMAVQTTPSDADAMQKVAIDIFNPMRWSWRELQPGHVSRPFRWVRLAFQ